jgi:putative transposase
MGGTRTTGRKRFIIVDTAGRLLGVLVVGADWSEQQGARELLAQLLPQWPRLRKRWADRGYRGLGEWRQRQFGVEWEIVTRAAERRGFVVLPRCWGVERSLAWLGRCRRLAKEYEHLAESSRTLIYLAACHRLLKRLAPNPQADPVYARRR